MAKHRSRMRLKRLPIIAAWVTLVAFGSGCQQGNASTEGQQTDNPDSDLSAWVKKTEQLLEELEPIGDQVTRSVTDGAGRVTSSANEEVQKLFRWEYKVADIPAEFNSGEIEAFLMGLGKERWECFHIEPQGGSLRAFCKRPPRSPLRYVPYLRNPF